MYDEYPNSSYTDQWQDCTLACAVVTVRPVLVITYVVYLLVHMKRVEHKGQPDNGLAKHGIIPLELLDVDAIGCKCLHN